MEKKYATYILSAIHVLFFMLICSVPFVHYSGIVDAYNTPKTLLVSSGTWFLVLLTAIYNILATRKVELNIGWNAVGIIGVSLLVVLSWLRLENRFYFADTLQQYIELLLLFLIGVFVHKSKEGISNKINNVKHIVWIAAHITLLVLGIYQYFSFKSTLATRAFMDNSGIYAIYVVACLPITIGAIKALVVKPMYRSFFATFMVLLSIMVLVFTQSRSALLAGVVIALILGGYKLWKIKKAFIIKYKRMLSIVWVVLLGSIIYLTTQYKTDSIKGRLLIWESTLQMIKDKPLLGHGIGQFLPVKNVYQVENFKTQNFSDEDGYYVDDLEFAFNDYFQIASTMGVIGILLILTLLIYNLNAYMRSLRLDMFVLAALGAILIAALFSYPLQRSSTQVLLVFILSLLCSNEREYFYRIRLKPELKGGLSMACLFLAGFMMHGTLETARAEKKWNDLAKGDRRGINPYALEREFQYLYDKLKSNDLFIFNYGATMFNIGLHERATSLLSESQACRKDYEGFLYLAMSNEKLGEIMKAEANYLNAIWLIPHKVYPKYRLCKLYYDNNMFAKAKVIAEVALEYNPKFSTKESYELIEKIKEVLESIED